MVNCREPVPEVGLTVSQSVDRFEGNTETVHAWLLSVRFSARLEVVDCELSTTNGWDTDIVPGLEPEPAKLAVTVAVIGFPLWSAPSTSYVVVGGTLPCGQQMEA